MQKRFYLSRKMSPTIALTAAMILALGLLATAGFAQKKPMEITSKPSPNLVTLSCDRHPNDLSAQAHVTNNSGQTIPKGAKITAQQPGLKGFVVLNAPLAVGHSVNVDMGGHYTDWKPCRAFYFKQ